MTNDIAQSKDDRQIHTPYTREEPMMLFNRHHQSLNLAGFYQGQDLFMCMGGPSLQDVDLGLLEQRGIVTMAVNNAWSVVRPNLWLCVDSPQSFIDAGWRDPGIIKLCPIGCSKGKLRIRDRESRKLGPWLKDDRTPYTPSDMPGVLYYRRNSRFCPETFFTESSVNWGGDEKFTDRLGIRGKRNVMLAALRMAFYLGFRRINIIGADFQMQYGRQNYAWGQERSMDAVRHNGSQYVAMNKRMKALEPFMRCYDLTIFNTLKDSGLVEGCTYRTLEKCVEEALKRVDTDMDASGWYDDRDDKEQEFDYEVIYEGLYRKGYHDEQRDQSWAFQYLWPYCQENLAFKVALDVGASYGGLVQRMGEAGYKALGVEVAPTACLAAKENGLDVRHGSACAIPLRDAAADLVISADVLEHIHPRDITGAMQEMIRVSNRYLAIKVCCADDRAHWKDVAGLPLHQTVMPHEWWVSEFMRQAQMLKRGPSLIHERRHGTFVIELKG